MSKQPEFKPPPFFYPVEADLFQPVASFRQSIKEGNHYYVRFEITRELWELFEEPDPGLHLRGPLYRVRDDASDETPADKEKAKEKPKREKKPEQPKGPHSSFWHSFCAGGRFNSLDLWQVLGAQDAKAAEDALRQAFGVSSRTFISPQDFILWLDKNELNYLATQARRITAEAGL
jgi:hypothetical protein